MHGGIGRSINSVEQIEKLERPITMDVGSIILMDLLWYLNSYATPIYIISVTPLKIYTDDRSICRSDPTENDSIEGLRPNARGPGLVTFGVYLYIIFYETACLLNDYNVALKL